MNKPKLSFIINKGKTMTIQYNFPEIELSKLTIVDKLLDLLIIL